MPDTPTLSLRDRLAFLAMQGLCAAENPVPAYIAENAYQIADAMIAKRNSLSEQE